MAAAATRNQKCFLLWIAIGIQLYSLFRAYQWNFSKRVVDQQRALSVEKESVKEESFTKKQRLLPFTNHPLYADWLFSTDTGSFWLPQPPKSMIQGYHLHVLAKQQQEEGFLTKDSVAIRMHPDLRREFGILYSTHDLGQTGEALSLNQVVSFGRGKHSGSTKSVLVGGGLYRTQGQVI